MPGGLEVTPRDDLTKQPLSLFTQPRDFHVEGLDCMAEFHHQQHPGNDIELGNDAEGIILPANDPRRSEGLAVRYSKGQMVASWLHDLYHDMFHGPQLPLTPAEKQRSVLFGLAKVIPVQAIEIYEPGAYRKVNLNKEQYDFIRRTTFHEGAGRSWEQGNRRGRIGRFLAEYALQNFLPEIIDEREIELNTERFFLLDEQLSKPRELRWAEEEYELKKGQPTNKQLKIRELSIIGDKIVHQTLMASIEPLRPLYEEAIKLDMVRGTKRDLGHIAIKFFGQGRFPVYSEQLKKYIEIAQNKNSERTAEEFAVSIAA